MKLFAQRMRLLQLLCLCAQLTVLSWPLSAQESGAQEKGTRKDEVKPAQLKVQLREVQSRIRSEQSRLEKLERERETIRKRLNKLDSAKTDTESKLDRTQDSVVRLSTEAERLKLTLFGARQQMEHQRARMHRRLVGLYKTKKRSPTADYLFKADSTTDLLKRAKYLSRVTEHDQEYITELSDIVRQGNSDRKRLEELLAARRTHLAELSNLDTQLERQRNQTAHLLREQEAKKDQQESSLLALKLSANQLQSMLEKVMDDVQERVEKSPSADLKGLARVRGSLVFPVKGSLVQTFGKQRHNEFEDILFKKGLEVRCDPGAEVKSVADGVVILRQELAGYGPVVILDHGNRYYTLYGRLAVTQIGMGAKVKKGEVLGYTGALDNRGRNFYFELRYRGKAQNPKRYFARLPKQS